jgi:N-acetyl-1-D-myo-inositol-2-amino-2-deoxy-alpha-D-glucopyranoside deacetylase
MSSRTERDRRTGTIIAVVAHPDDESLIAGGTLALAARAGVGTGVVSLTRGEQGPIADPSLATRERLGEVRATELGVAAHALGVDWAICLSYADGELPWVDHEAAAEELARMIGPHAPLVLLTFGEDGLYGHPDHSAAAEITTRAVRLLDGPVELYAATWRSGLVKELAAAAAERGLPHDLWGLDAEAFGADREPTVTIDVRPVLSEKLAALRAHRTQLGSDHLLAALPADLAERYLGDEPWAGHHPERLEELLAGD